MTIRSGILLVAFGTLLISFLIMTTLQSLFDRHTTKSMISDVSAGVLLGFREHDEMASALAERYFSALIDDYTRIKTITTAAEFAKLFAAGTNMDNQTVIAAISKTNYLAGYAIGYNAIMDSSGRIVLSPNTLDRGKTPQELDNAFHHTAGWITNSLSKNFASRYFEYYAVDNRGTQPSILCICPIPGLPYFLFSVYSANLCFQPLIENVAAYNEKHTKIGLAAIRDYFSGELSKKRSFVLATSAAIILISFFLSLWLAHTIAKPIVQLRDGVQKIAGGKFDTQVTLSKTCIEITELAKSFNQLGGELTNYIENLSKEITARHNVEHEIELARSVQEGILPKVTPAYIRKEFSLGATLKPAKDMAGDFYDFFYIDDNRLALIIGDVSGKGIAAALFMTRAKTLLYHLLHQGSASPAEVLKQANASLVLDNPLSMFVTLFLAYYDISEHKLVYANAGHHAAIMVGAKGACRTFGWFGDAILGFDPDRTYHEGIEEIGIGETLVLYTDGVTEAESATGQLYGQQRLEDELTKNYKLSVRDISNYLVRTVDDYEGFEHSDDITLLLFRREC